MSPLIGASGQTVTVRRPVMVDGRGGRDAFGDRHPMAEHTVGGCVFAPGGAESASGSREYTDRGLTVVTDHRLYGPPDADLRADDVVVTADGRRWEVQGDPAVWTDPWTGQPVGTVVILQAVRG